MLDASCGVLLSKQFSDVIGVDPAQLLVEADDVQRHNFTRDELRDLPAAVSGKNPQPRLDERLCVDVNVRVQRRLETIACFDDVDRRCVASSDNFQLSLVVEDNSQTTTG